MSVKHSLVVPCYNEQDNVALFFDAACRAMEGYTHSFELVFVNDGSKDDTADRLNALYAAHPEIKITVVHFARNFGKEAAILAGLTHARGQYVTVIDGDMQQPPEKAVEMGRFLDEHPDIDAVAAYPANRREKGFMRWCKRKFYKVINRVSDVTLVEEASDFRTLRRKVVDALLRLPEYHRFSKGLFSFVGFRTHALPYDVAERATGTTKWNFFKLLRYALDGIMAYTDMPLKLPLWLGGFMSVVGAGGLIAAGIVKLCDDFAVVMGWALAALIMLVGGLILVSLGVMGAYIGKIHTQVKNRPVFITRDVYSYPED